MAVTFNYPNAYANCVHVYRATGGGVTFSANLAGTAVFDYFDNAAVVNDAIYFSSPGANSGGFANLKVNVGTAIAGTGITGVWEYRTLNGWETCHDLTDPTAGFTVTGANTIIFPVQAGMSVDYSVNGVATYGWIRYRITAITTITEGGANQTSAPQVGDGYFTINGGTDATPATFEDVYNYVVASAPEIGASKPASSIYKFNNMRINIASRLKTTNEQVFIGNGCAGGHLIYYLEAGTKVGTDGWKDHSSIFFCTRLGTNCLVTSAGNTKFYGGVLGSFNNYVNGYQRTFNSYLGITYGEWIGVSVFNRSGYFTNLTCNKCTVQGGLITSPFPASYPTNLRISDPGAYIWAIYSSGGTINNVSYALPTACIFNWNQYGAEGITINFVNPTPVLPAQNGAAPKVVNRSIGGLTNLTKCFFYDASADTYTDYTTASTNATADDVPLNGDVGDCLYFNNSTWQNYWQIALAFTITNQSNDYVYAWEYWKASAWQSCTPVTNGDTTANLTTTGKVYLPTPSIWVSTTVNGTAGLWIRLRIVTKGSGTPTCSKIQNSIQTGIGNWRIYEKMSVVLKVVDSTGTAIQGATVKLTDVLGTVTTLTTDASGLTTSTDMTISTIQHDARESDTNFNVAKSTHNPYTLTISKDGYETYSSIENITAQVNKTIALKTEIRNLIDQTGRRYRRVDKTNSLNNAVRRRLIRH